MVTTNRNGDLTEVLGYQTSISANSSAIAQRKHSLALIAADEPHVVLRLTNASVMLQTQMR